MPIKESSIINIFIEKMNQAQDEMREAEAENGGKKISSHRKAAVLLAIEAFRF